MSGHIPLPQLALYGGGDLPPWNRWLIRRHLQACDECARVADDFTQMREALSQSAERLPEPLSEAGWQSLAAEMTANIRLGMAAGACVSIRPKLFARPRIAFALAGLAILLVVAGVETSVRKNAPAFPAVADESGLRTLEASSSGIAVHSAGHMLAVSAPPGIDAAHDVIQTVNTRGDVHSRYTDDTGVTINAVYADAE